MESARLKVAGIAFTAVLAAVGIAAVLGGIGYGAFGEEGRIGPGFLPILAGGLVAFFAIFDIVGRVRSSKTPDTLELALGGVLPESVETPVEDGTAVELDADDDLDIFGRTQKQRNRMLVMVLGIVIVSLLLVNVIGFLLALGLMLFACAFVVERRNWLPSLIVTIAAVATGYLVFGVLLRVPLPQGLLGIL